MHKKRFLAIACGALALVLIAGFSGYAIGKRSASGHPQISAQISDNEDEYHVFTSDDLGITFNGEVTYNGLSQVSIQLGDTVIALEDALKSGRITAEELIASIRLDAETGVCKESTSSENGLSRFLYQYQDFEVEIVYDVYETPAKGARIIRELCFYPLGKSHNASSAYLDDEIPGEWIDREDWGITLEAPSVTSSGMVLKCAQSGGQQLGSLRAEYFVLSCDGSPVGGQIVPIACDAPLTMDGSCELTLNWSDAYGELPADRYTLFLFIRDEYDPSQVHPLMRNFYDVQVYKVEFDVS